jgi:ribosome-associated protein
LWHLLKFEGIADSGGEAKNMIDIGEVSVNGNIETQKRKKILSGDTITIGEKIFNIHLMTE